MAEQSLETYHGNCHCGAFKFSVKLDAPLKQAFACNCSICSKKGYLWAMPSSDDLFVVEKGDGVLKDYFFGNKTMVHKFCPTCGTAVMGKRTTKGPSLGINVRTFNDFDESKLEIKPYDGAALPPPYTPPHGSEVSDLNASTKLYRGSCHCGAVTFDLQSKPLEEIELLSCNCSICSRNANLWIYPSQESVTLHNGTALTPYQFASKVARHSFCPTCGVTLVNQFERSISGVEEMNGKLPVNVRAIDGVDWTTLKVRKVDGKGFGPKYEV